MSDSSTSKVNQQIIDAASHTNTLVVGVARGQSLALAYESLANAVNLMMLNATQNQFGVQKVEVAMVASTCAQIIKAGTK
ncbi:MAG TPA: RebB family R body protein [Enhygromyxa sp.]|nr:RebB family R body protein [Enhygromyxa sp.]